MTLKKSMYAFLGVFGKKIKIIGTINRLIILPKPIFVWGKSTVQKTEKEKRKKIRTGNNNPIAILTDGLFKKKNLIENNTNRDNEILLGAYPISAVLKASAKHT